MQYKTRNVGIKYLEKNLAYLKPFIHAKKKDYSKLIKKGDMPLINTLCESMHNILNGKLPISKNEKLKLFKYRNIIRQICDKNHNFHKAKKLLQEQKGGFLSVLIPAVITGLSTIIGSLIK